MTLWLAIDTNLKALGVEEANVSEQAYYQFMQKSIYPDHVIKLPSDLILRKEFPSGDDYYRLG